MKKEVTKLKDGSMKESSSETLLNIGVGEEATVCSLSFTGRSLQRLVDLGLSRGASVRCVGRSPLGDPRAYEIRGAVIAIRGCDARKIGVVKAANTK